MAHQVQSLGQNSSVLPQQIQLLKLFHLTSMELQNRIQEELMENPMLDELVSEEDKKDEATKEDSDADYDGPEEFKDDDIPDYAVEHNNYLSETNMPQRPIPELADFRKELKEQLHPIIEDKQQLMLAEYLIDSLNDSGMLEQEISDMADDLSFQKNKLIGVAELECARKRLHELEPAGIGSANIKEFLLLQLQKLDKNNRLAQLAIQLLEKNFNDLSHGNMEKIAASLGLDENELRDVLKMIGSCKLKPLAESTGPIYGDSITIDFVITQQDEDIEVALFRQRSSTLFINHSLQSQLTNGKQIDKGTTQYMKSKLTSAQWFISAIQERENTMLSVMKAIVKLQTAYFRDGDIRLLKPMILKNIADAVGVHISTVSRITCNKYADTPFGTVLLKNLFSKGIENKQGEAISNRVIQLAIEEVVNGESKLKPYTDQQLVSVLAMKGFNIARRTVAKYREQRQIPIVQLRALLT